MNQRVDPAFFAQCWPWLLAATAGCGSFGDLASKQGEVSLELHEAPVSTRRIAEALLPTGTWLSITRGMRGSLAYWRFVRRVQPDDVREYVLDEAGNVLARTLHRDGVTATRPGSAGRGGTPLPRTSTSS